MMKIDQLNFKLYDGIFEQICSIDNLFEAFKEVNKNKGAPGIDNETLEDFKENKEENLHGLKKEVETWNYCPSPVRRVEIPKPDGGVRLLGVPTVKDRILHASIKIALEPIFEERFSENSYGFRPRKNQQQAIAKAKEFISDGKEWVVDMDLSKFFDRINHDRLLFTIGTVISDKRVIKLVAMILRSGVMVDGKVQHSKLGSPQGSPLSPLLSNIVLDELDKELEKRNLEFCRFADDCNIFVGSEKAGKRVMEKITIFVEKKLKLKVNTEKSKVAKSKFVKFLGLTILTGAICISVVSMNKAMEKVKELTPRGTHLPIEKSIEKINQWYVGWSAYYKMTEYPSQLRKIEAHVRRRLRARWVEPACQFPKETAHKGSTTKA